MVRVGSRRVRRLATSTGVVWPPNQPPAWATLPFIKDAIKFGEPLLPYINEAIEFAEPLLSQEERRSQAALYVVATTKQMGESRKDDQGFNAERDQKNGRQEEQKLLTCLDDTLVSMERQRRAGMGLVHFSHYFDELLGCHSESNEWLARSRQVIRRSPRLTEQVFAAPRDWHARTNWSWWSSKIEPTAAEAASAHHLRDFLNDLPPSLSVTEACRRVASKKLATDCTDASTWTLLKTAIDYLGDEADTVFASLKLAPLVRPRSPKDKTPDKTQDEKTAAKTDDRSGDKTDDCSWAAPLDLFKRPWARRSQADEVPAGTRVWFRGVPWYRLKHVYGVGGGMAAVATSYTDAAGGRLFATADFDHLVTEREVLADLELDYLLPRSDEELAFVDEFGDPFDDLRIANVFMRSTDDDLMDDAALAKARAGRHSIDACASSMGILPGDIHQRLCPNTLLLLRLAAKQGNLAPSVFPALRTMALLQSLHL